MGVGGGSFVTSSFSSSSSSFGGGRSRSVQTHIVNGRQTTVIREVDEYGNETVQTQSSDGRRSVSYNGQSLPNGGAGAPSIMDAGWGGPGGYQ